MWECKNFPADCSWNVATSEATRIPCKQQHLFMWHLSGATTQSSDHSQIPLLLPQFCKVYCEERSPNSPFIFAVSSASFLPACLMAACWSVARAEASTHTHTYTRIQTYRQLECNCQSGAENKQREQNSPTLVLIYTAVTVEYDSFEMQIGYAGYTGYTHVQFTTQ